MSHGSKDWTKDHEAVPAVAFNHFPPQEVQAVKADDEEGPHGEDEESRGVSKKNRTKYYDSSHPSSGEETSLPSSKEHSVEVLKKDETASLILGAERTLFAALNNAWLLAIGGIGLMSVGNDDARATNGGALILSLAIASTSIAYGMHVWRVNQMKNNKPFQLSHTIVWSSVIAALTLATLVLELYFGVMHPYLDREKTVVIAGGL